VTNGGPAKQGARRRLTVMFCDLVGSTAIAERLDPEEMRELLVAYHRTCAEVVSRFEGDIVQYQGDGLLVCFGHPVAHEDDARRSVLAGLDIVEAVGRVVGPVAATLRGVDPSAPTELPLSVRVGIHTGLVVLGEMGAGDWRQAGHVVGDAVNIAARVQAVAEPGSVVLTSATYHLVRGYVRVVSAGRPHLKGVTQPIELFRALGSSGAESRSEAMPWRQIDLVGRADERDALDAAWQGALAGRTQSVLLVGEAGIGKSRLVDWVRQHVETQAVTQVLQCSPYHTSTALHPVVAVLERVAGMVTGDDAATRWRRLTDLLTSVGGIDEVEASLLASLLAIPLPAHVAPLLLSSDARREKTFATLMAWVERTAARYPLLLAVEDLHWADPSTLELLSRLVARRPAVPLLVLFTSRNDPEALAAPGTRLPLGPLAPFHVREMVDRLADGNLPAHLSAALAERSDGIPLFIEELTCSVTDLPLGAERRGTTEADGDIPPMLADLFTARLEQLPDRGYVAQVVATMAPSVPLSVLALVLPEDEVALGDVLQAMVDAGVLIADPAMLETTYMFRHALLRDAAYQSQLLSQRRGLHLRIAEVLDGLPDMAASRPEVLGRHFELGGRPLRAARCWLQAGRNAAALAAHAEAVGHLSQALAALAAVGRGQESGRVDELELELQMELGCSLLVLRGYASPEVEATYRRARELSARARHCGGPIEDGPSNHEHAVGPALVSLYGLWAYYVVRGEHQEGLPTL